MLRCSCCLLLPLILACSSADPEIGAQVGAWIRPARELQRRVLIRSIDGRARGWLRGATRLSPGPHHIEVMVVIEFGDRDAFASHSLEIDARAGAQYSLHAEWARWGPAAVLRDARTRARLASAEPLPPVSAGR